VYDEDLGAGNPLLKLEEIKISIQKVSLWCLTPLCIGGRLDSDIIMVVGFTTTCAISAYYH
jgi:hypothetical protein